MADVSKFDFLGTELNVKDAQARKEKVSKPVNSPNGRNGQLLRTNGDGTTTWVDQGLPTDAQTATAVNDWMTAHPEATTTVLDGSITEAKLNDSLKSWIREGKVNVLDYGAVGDGITDDTTAVQNAINAADGAEVFFSDGTYLVETINIPDNMYLHLSPNATIKSAVRSTGGDIFFSESLTGANVLIEGGTFDFNVGNHSIKPYGFVLYLPHDTQFVMRGTLLKDIQRFGFYINKFGGYFEMSNCEVRGQAEADSENNEAITGLVLCNNGEAGHKGLFRFNHNRCYGVDNATLPGGAPGGVFLSCRDEGVTAHGNESTAEFIGNYFYGYGANHGISDISPIHFYPHWGGARIIGNYFEKCAFCAISAKSVTDCIIADNVVINGQFTPVPGSGDNPGGNINSEGAISYVSGYMGWGQPRPRGIIIGNIVRNPGGVEGTTGQAGITVRGATMTTETGDPGTTYADEVLVANNLLSGCGYGGIFIDRAIDVTVRGNEIIDLVEGAGIRTGELHGRLVIDSNVIEGRGSGITHINPGTDSDAEIICTNNVIRVSNQDTTKYGMNLRGIKATIRNNRIEMIQTAYPALYVTQANKVRVSCLDLYGNEIISGTTSIVMTSIDKVSGFVWSNVEPNGNITPEKAGVLYRNTSKNTLFISTGSTNDSWISMVGGKSSTSTNVGSNNTVDTTSFALGGNNIVSGQYSGAFGTNNNVQFARSFAFGDENRVSGDYSFALGRNSVGRKTGVFAYACGAFSTAGDNQTEMYVCRAKTSDGTSTNIMKSAAAAIQVPLGFSFLYHAFIIARSEDDVDTAAWEIRGMTYRGATGQSYVVGNTIDKIGATNGAANWEISSVIGGSTGIINVMATGAADTNIRWSSKLELVEVGVDID